jgi:hypothetical protein
MYKVACSRKEASCIIGSLLVELAPVCEKCGGLPDGVLNLQTEAGLSLTGDADVLITGHSIISGKPVRIKLTDYGFEYYGDHAELARVREKRCVYHGRASVLQKKTEIFLERDIYPLAEKTSPPPRSSPCAKRSSNPATSSSERLLWPTTSRTSTDGSCGWMRRTQRRHCCSCF